MRNENSYRSGMRSEYSDESGSGGLWLMFLAGFGTGAAFMYLFDPDRGRRRRALIRDQAVGFTNDAREAINATSQDLSNRAYGVYAEARKAVTGSAVASEREKQAGNTQQTDETQGGTGIERGAGQR